MSYCTMRSGQGRVEHDVGRVGRTVGDGPGCLDNTVVVIKLDSLNPVSVVVGERLRKR
jgi:hypothetical protein